MRVGLLGLGRIGAFHAAPPWVDEPVVSDVDDSAALLTPDPCTLVTVQGSRYNGAGYDVRMEPAGTLKTQVVGLNPHTPLTSAEGLQPPDDPWPDFVTGFEAAHVAEPGAFLGTARGEADSPCTIEDALATLHLAEAAELSRHEGRPVRVAEVVR
jgi:myo-inositol 2-dehydrogenase / D-chiro-inositol 1-dehydrogenase